MKMKVKMLAGLTRVPLFERATGEEKAKLKLKKRFWIRGNICRKDKWLIGFGRRMIILLSIFEIMTSMGMSMIVGMRSSRILRSTSGKSSKLEVSSIDFT